MTALNVLVLVLLLCPGGLALSRTSARVQDRSKFGDCQKIVDGCQSVLEVKQDDKCVMADELPQHDMGTTIDESISKFQSMLEEYYGNASVLEKMMSMSKEGNAILVQKMARALDKKKFVVGAIGSSVTAGHDNCHVDAYPSQLASLLSPLFKQAGVEFEARNGGIGGACGDTFIDQTNCLEHIVGDDVDVTHWSWDYFDPDNSESQENFIRISLSMPNQPMPMLLTLGRDYYPSHAALFELYGASGYHSMAASLGTPPQVPDMEAVESIKWKFVGDGRHTVTRLADKFPDSHCRRKSTSELWRNWHGGPMLYQLISDALGWTYVSALKEALIQQRSGKLIQKPERIPLPEGQNSARVAAPRCISFNKPSVGASSVTLVTAQSGNVELSEENHRKDMIPEGEENELRCEHLDACGTANSDDGRLTFDLQAKYKNPLTEGILVVCIGGGPPEGTDKLISISNLRSISIASVPGVAYFPRCSLGSVESIEVDGQKQSVSNATMWPQMKKCGEFKVDKNARYVTVRSPCGVTHLFAV